MIKVLLLGSTGSIGKSTINCLKRYPDKFELVGVAANSSSDLILEQANEFKTPYITLFNKEAADKCRSIASDAITVFDGEEGLLKMVQELDYDILLNALVGAAGFKSTVAALKRDKRVALANKESLVIGGELIMDLIAKGHGQLLPVDSEHSAILQCLNGENCNSIESITVTASGGPFREVPLSDFPSITPEKALKHPTWEMGSKITIDSSTLVNKGFEVIEAHYFFNLSYDNIHVLVHPQSIIHSMITFQDGSTIAQCGLPDMELPIQYALTYPERFPINGKRMDLSEICKLTFEKPDFSRFPGLRLCIEAGKSGGTLMSVLNAANEIAVDQFLRKNISFTELTQLIEEMLNAHINGKADSIETIMEVDKQTREKSLQLVKKWRSK